jgi:hypothetical protein
MASTYSSNLKIELMATGENSGTWGTNTNTNLGTAMEQAIIGLGNPDYTSDANLTITITDSSASQTARCLVLNVTSVFGALTATRELIVPTIQKQYIVQNNTTGGQSITVKTSAGTGITVPNGRKAHLYVDGTNVIQMFDFVDINGGTIDGVTVGASSASTGAFTTLTASGATTLNGTVALGDAVADTLTLNGQFVTGTVLRSAQTATNTLNLAAYDVDGAAYTNLVTLTASNTPTLALTSTGVGTIDNMSVGATTASTGAFTTLSSTGNTTLGDSSTDTVTVTARIASNVLPSADNTYDLGSAANAWKDLYIDGTATIDILNATTLDLTNLEVTNIKAKDGTASIVLADTTGIATFSNATVISTTDNTNAALRITQLGTGNAFVVEDSASVDATPFVIDAAGLVGAGTGTPLQRLHVIGNTTLNTGVAPGSNGFGISVYASDFPRISLRNSTTGDTTADGLQIYMVGNDVTYELRETGYQAWETSSTERMRIDSSGNVGIGTSSPGSLLEVSQSGGGVLTLRNSNTSQSANDVTGRIDFASSDTTSPAVQFSLETITTNAGGLYDFRIRAAANERMRIDSSGNVGIGTSSPTSTLSVTGTANVTGNVTLGDATTDTVTVNGYMGVGGAGASNKGMYQRNTALTGIGQYGVTAEGTFSSAATSLGIGFASSFSTEAAAFTMANAIGFRAFDIAKGAGSTITNQHGVYIADQTQGTNNYGITSLVSSGTDKWNIYASGTAQNYFAGNVGIGTTNIVGSALGTNGKALSLSIESDINGNSTSGSVSVGTKLISFSGIAGPSNYTAASLALHQTGSVEGVGDFRFSTGDGAGALTERIRLNSSGSLLLGLTSSRTNNLSSASLLQLEAVNSAATGALVRNSADTSGAGLILGKSRGTSVGSFTAVVSGDRLGTLSFSGTDGTTMLSAATIFSEVDGTPGTNDMPGRLVFSTTADGGSSPTERMRIDSSGNVGIGTSSPGTKLTVSTGVAGNLAYFTDAINADFYIKTASSIATIGPNAGSTNLAFQTSGTERARIDPSGNLLVGKAVTTIGTVGTVLAGPRIIISNSASTGADDGLQIYSTGASAYRFFVTMAGSVNATSTSITAISDITLKQNIRDLETGLTQVMALKPRRFDWKEETQIGETNVAGFIAQEVEQVLPELVYEYKYNDNETKKSIKMGDILPTLVKAIQEQQALITSLTARITALESI